jgi:hypothetical protein
VKKSCTIAIAIETIDGPRNKPTRPIHCIPPIIEIRIATELIFTFLLIICGFKIFSNKNQTIIKAMTPIIVSFPIRPFFSE